MNRAPEINDQVIANREAFIEALLAEDPSAQCEGQMFDTTVAGKELRCALGVAARLFLGIHNEREYKAYSSAPERRDPYAELEKILGLRDANEVYRLNDTEEGMRPFPEIANKLTAKWSLGK